MEANDPRHGTNAGYRAHTAEGTPQCFPCRLAHHAYEEHRTRQVAYGRWHPWTDATPAREHVTHLQQQGMSLRRIAEAVGTSTSRISHLVYGRNGNPPPTKIRPDYAANILALQPSPRMVPVVGVQRRLAALMAIGYSQPFLARELGWTQAKVWEFLNVRTQVPRETREVVVALYDRLSMTLPPEATKSEKYSASRARGTAARCGFVPPLAWDDIDDPDEEPKVDGVARRGHSSLDAAVVARLLAGERVQSTRAEKEAAMARWLASGRPERLLCDTHGWKSGRYVPRDEDAA